MKYDPETAPVPEKWLALDETQRLDLVSAHHRRMRVKLPNANLHAAAHVIVENQRAQGFALAKEALDRLRAERGQEPFAGTARRVLRTNGS